MGQVARLLMGLWVMSVSVARATPNFPGGIQRHLGLSNPPKCSLCHNGEPSSATANTLFAQSMRRRGLQKGNIETLERALDALQAENTDSNGDGIPDIVAIKDGNDPNLGAASGGPQYGCGAHIAHATSCSATAWLVALVCLLWRRRRQH